MKINKQETYSLDGLNKDELMFILEVVDQLKLTEDSSPASIKIAKKFKELREEMFEQKPLENSDGLQCDGCDSTTGVEVQECPIQKTDLPLCPICYLHRTHHIGGENEQHKANTASG